MSRKLSRLPEKECAKGDTFLFLRMTDESSSSSSRPLRFLASLSEGRANETREPISFSRLRESLPLSSDSTSPEGPVSRRRPSAAFNTRFAVCDEQNKRKETISDFEIQASRATGSKTKNGAKKLERNIKRKGVSAEPGPVRSCTDANAGALQPSVHSGSRWFACVLRERRGETDEFHSLSASISHRVFGVTLFFAHSFSDLRASAHFSLLQCAPLLLPNDELIACCTVLSIHLNCSFQHMVRVNHFVFLFAAFTLEAGSTSISQSSFYDS
jgi:hypothetical protein